MSKTFIIPAHAIQDVATGHGACFASDQITVEGQKVGFMYREQPENDSDSGWRFLSGHESQQYLDDPNNLAIYDVNTIANYDADIVSLLSAPVGVAFARSSSGHFVQEVVPHEDA